MARIPEEELVRIKQESDLLALVRASGVELTRHGKDWGAVPLSRGPRAVAGGLAGEGGVALPGRLPQRRQRDRLGDEEPRRGLPRGRRGAARPRRSASPPAAETAKPPAPPLSEGERGALLEEVLRHYQQSLAASAEAQEYAAARLMHLLHEADVGAALEHQRREGVAKHVARALLGDARGRDVLMHDGSAGAASFLLSC